MTSNLTRGDILNAAGRMFGVSWTSDPSAVAFVNARASRYLSRLADLRRKSAQGKRAKQAAAVVIGSFDARFCSVVLGWPKSCKPVGLKYAEQLAREINPTQASREVIHVRFQSKPEGGFRPICTFGPDRRARQILVKHVLSAIWGTAKFEFAQRGRGRDAAWDKITDNVEKKGGSRWFLTADIRDCFSSFDDERICGIIPLSRNVVANCILVDSNAPIIDEDGNRTRTSEIAALSGLPQGSLASPYIASKLIEPMLDQLNGEIVISHVDDIIVGTRTLAQAQANRQMLGDLLEDHPAGPLFMKSDIARLGKPIDYLGYRMRRRWLRFGGGVRLTPSAKAYSRFERRLFEKVIECDPSKIDLVADEYRLRWENSMRRWDISEVARDLLWYTSLNVIGAAKQKKAALHDR